MRGIKNMKLTAQRAIDIIFKDTPEVLSTKSVKKLVEQLYLEILRKDKKIKVLTNKVLKDQEYLGKLGAIELRKQILQASKGRMARALPRIKKLLNDPEFVKSVIKKSSV